MTESEHGAALEREVGERLNAGDATLATAESCSGGLIAHRITNVPGSSGYFLGGVVSYSNESKVAMVDVNESTLARRGAVSEEVAGEMAEGVRERFEADYGLSVTGIAGPSGGSPEKPVGLVFIAVAGPSGTHVERRVFSGDRESIKQQTAEKALEYLLERLP